MTDLKRKYISAFRHIRRGGTPSGPAPHKLILLLAVIHEMEVGHILQNRIEITDSLTQSFQTIWQEYVHTNLKPTFAQPFFHIQNDNFWHPQVFTYKQHWFDTRSTITQLNQLRENVKYATFDQELFELLAVPVIREEFKRALIEGLTHTGYTSISDHEIGQEPCLFCGTALEQKIIAESRLAWAFYDKYPVSEGHTLIVPKRHVADYFDLKREELSDIHELSFECKDILVSKYHPDGFNFGVNIGKAAGQSIFHCHLHLIPRYRGDVANPLGGIRSVITDRRDYTHHV